MHTSVYHNKTHHMKDMHISDWYSTLNDCHLDFCTTIQTVLYSLQSQIKRQPSRNKVTLSNNDSQCSVMVHSEPCCTMTHFYFLFLQTINLQLITASVWLLHIASCLSTLTFQVWEPTSLVSRQSPSSANRHKKCKVQHSDKEIKLVLSSPHWQLWGNHFWRMWECDLTGPCSKMILFSVLTNYHSEMTLISQRTQYCAKTVFRGTLQCNSTSQHLQFLSQATWLNHRHFHIEDADQQQLRVIFIAE